MFKGYKVRLNPTKEENEYLLKIFRLSIRMHNFCLDALKSYYKETDNVLSYSKVGEIIEDYRKIFHINDSLYPFKSISKICYSAREFFQKYVDNQTGPYNYKSFLSAHHSIELDSSEFYLKDDQLFINAYHSKYKEKGGMKFRVKNFIPKTNMMYNPRLSYDGIDFYFSASFKVDEIIKNEENNKNFSLGIDVGIANWVTLSNGMVFPNINDTPRMIKLEKMARDIQRKKSISRNRTSLEHKRLSNNYLKLHRRYLILRRKQKDIRRNYCYQVVNQIVNLNPSCICIEDIKVKDLSHENELAKQIFEAMFYEFRTILEYKCKWNNIKLIVASRYYPSSKLCSRCGFKIANLSLSDRTFICPNCGRSIDRDLNAAINLSKLSKKANMEIPYDDFQRKMQCLTSEN